MGSGDDRVGGEVGRGTVPADVLRNRERAGRDPLSLMMACVMIKLLGGGGIYLDRVSPEVWTWLSDRADAQIHEGYGIVATVCGQRVGARRAR